MISFRTKCDTTGILIKFRHFLLHNVADSG
ncbi:hypothetical protein DET61_11319 [Marinobacter nauticus]|mgnify:FL=1|jgi:hypothetical protein|uniref:Uncharacterized protein n=1 Tax=Marinobacter nauticus TaxID=2743 RepID=A0A368XCN5_MARNT|nr:hypothetical protein DET61_11319 [Marinobacter nauticus]